MPPSAAQYMRAVSNVHVFAEAGVMYDDIAHTQVMYCSKGIMCMISMELLMLMLVVCIEEATDDCDVDDADAAECDNCNACVDDMRSRMITILQCHTIQGFKKKTP